MYIRIIFYNGIYIKTSKKRNWLNWAVCLARPTFSPPCRAVTGKSIYCVFIFLLQVFEQRGCWGWLWPPMIGGGRVARAARRRRQWS